MTASFHQLLAEFLPRILSQCCRDANSPAFGCFDRNFWHYRMRDFSSIILQQGGYAGGIGIGPGIKTASQGAQVVKMGHQHHIAGRVGVRAWDEAQDIARQAVSGYKSVPPGVSNGLQANGLELLFQPEGRFPPPFRAGGAASQLPGAQVLYPGSEGVPVQDSVGIDGADGIPLGSGRNANRQEKYNEIISYLCHLARN